MENKTNAKNRANPLGLFNLLYLPTDAEGHPQGLANIIIGQLRGGQDDKGVNFSGVGLTLDHAVLGDQYLFNRPGNQVVAAQFDGMLGDAADIHLALLDLGMPVMDGEEVFPLLKRTRPQMPIVLCSGYGLDATARRLLDAGAAAFIQKPFRLNEMLPVIEQVLRGTSS